MSPKEQFTKTLQGLSGEAIVLTRMVIESGGELSPELEERLTVNESDIAVKIDSYVFIEKMFEREADSWKAQAAASREIAARFEKAQDSLRTRIKLAMKAMNRDELNGDIYRYKLCSAKAKLVIDEALLPEEYKMTVTTRVADKERIKQDLENDWEVQGCTLEATQSLRTYTSAKTN